jgi:hypothetical protein
VAGRSRSQSPSSSSRSESQALSSARFREDCTHRHAVHRLTITPQAEEQAHPSLLQDISLHCGGPLETLFDRVVCLPSVQIGVVRKDNIEIGIAPKDNIERGQVPSSLAKLENFNFKNPRVRKFQSPTAASIGPGALQS